jgi:hypothetical protein
MTNKLPNMSSRYGAPMGRMGSPHVDPDYTGKWSLCRVRIDSGGYDNGGAYWGHGAPLWQACTDDGESELFFRASSREAAKAHIRELCPTARFYR